MAYQYSDPERENETYALPDVEVWEDRIDHCTECGNEYPASFEECECGGEIVGDPSGKFGWWYQYGFPGCLPDGDVSGPYDNEQEALEAARE